MPSFSKNLQRFLVFFFTAISLILVVLGVSRAKKPVPVAEAPLPSPISPSPASLTGSQVITGAPYQTPWGNAVVTINVKDGKVVAVSMPSIPDSPPSIYAEPYLVEQALKAGSANIQGVSGATYTSIAFKSSLESAIAKAATQGQTITPNTTTPTATAGIAKPSVPRKYRDDDDEWGENDDNGGMFDFD